MSNLEWNEKMLPSEVLKQIREEALADKNFENFKILTTVIGQVEIMEFQQNVTAAPKPKRSSPKKTEEQSADAPG